MCVCVCVCVGVVVSEREREKRLGIIFFKEILKNQPRFHISNSLLQMICVKAAILKQFRHQALSPFMS